MDRMWLGIVLVVSLFVAALAIADEHRPRPSPQPAYVRPIVFCYAFLDERRTPPEVMGTLTDADCTHPIVEDV